jgi:hypothetical protein
MGADRENPVTGDPVGSRHARRGPHAVQPIRNNDVITGISRNDGNDAIGSFAGKSVISGIAVKTTVAVKPVFAANAGIASINMNARNNVNL